MRSPTFAAMRTFAAIALAASLAAAPAHAWTECQILGGDYPMGVFPPRSISARFHDDGTLAAVVMMSPSSGTTATDLVWIAAGRSYRLVHASDRAVFNLATRQPDGTTLVETWIGGPAAPAGSRNTGWMRLRCP